MRDLLIPAFARTLSIFLSTSAVCPFMSSDLSSATVPERKTRSPKTAALQFHSRGLILCISMICAFPKQVDLLERPIPKRFERSEAVERFELLLLRTL